MASRIKHSFKDGMLALIKGGWANRVARVCSYWAGKNGIDVLIPENPSGNSPCMVSLNIANATKLIVNEMTTNLGIKFDQNNQTLKLRLVTKTQNNSQVADYAAVYLPSLTLYFNGTAYTVTGVTAIADSNGWYKIGSRTTGNFYLNQSGSTTNLVWGTSGLADSTKVSYFVGSISFDATNNFKVTQYTRAMSGRQIVTEGGGTGGGDIPADNVTGTMIDGRMVKSNGQHTVTSSCFPPPDSHQLVAGPESMDGNVNCLPVLTQKSSITTPAIIANSGIEVVDMTTKNVIKGDNVKISAPSGSTLHEFDNVCVAADGTLKLDQTDYAYFNTYEDEGGQPIDDGEIVATDGTYGKVKTTGIKISDFIDAQTKKIEDEALDFMTGDAETGFEIDNENISAFDTGNCLLETDTDGYMQEGAAIPQAPESDKVLGVRSGENTASFMDIPAGNVAVAPFTVQAVTTTNQGVKTFSYAKIYLPSTTVTLWQEDFAIQQGTGAGQIQSLGSGWYRIYGVTAGDIFLIDASTYTTATSTTKKQLKFSNAALAVPNFSRKIANIASGVFTVTQFAPTVADKIEQPTDTADIARRTTITDHNNSALVPPASQANGFYQPDQNGWKRGVDYATSATMNQNARTLDTSNNAVSLSSLQRVGFKIQVVTRIIRNFDKDLFYWRWATFDKNGCLCELSAEQGCFAEVNYANYA